MQATNRLRLIDGAAESAALQAISKSGYLSAR